MQRNKPPKPNNKKMLLLVSAFFLFITFLGFTWVVYQNGALLRNLERISVTKTFIDQQRKMSIARSPALFRKMAERHQYFPHEPQEISAIFARALFRGPGDHSTFAAYAFYLSSLDCCRDQAIAAWDESIRRCPTNAKVRLVAASGYLAVGEKEKGIASLRAAVQLDSSLARRVYELGMKRGLQINDLIPATPVTPIAQLELVRFLLNSGNKVAIVNRALNHLVQLDLSNEQRLEAIRLALQAEQLDVAAEQARLASKQRQIRGDGFGYLAEIAWLRKDVAAFERYAFEAEKAHLDHGDLEKAGKTAFDAYLKTTTNPDRAASIKRMRVLVDRYPAYAPILYRMSQLVSDPGQQMFYLEKAAKLDPAGYQNQLANLYFQHGKFSEAEEIFKQLINVPQHQVEAYRGWSRCKLAQGDVSGALQVLKTGIETVRESPVLLFQLAEVYSSYGDYHNAALSYASYTRSEPSQLNGYLRAADAYMKLGQYLEARSQCLQVLERDPANADAQSKLAYLKTLGY
jgi:tetratricopeptide (TPR) repeat protein